MSENQPIVILDASNQPFLSIGVRYGGITFQNRKYVYIAEHDAYVRNDYVSKIKRHNTWVEFLDYVKTINSQEK